MNPPLTREQLGEKLTMAGLEVEGYAPVAEKFSHVVVAQVVQVEKHPEADRLHLCQVDIGKPQLLNIVCGAKNVKAGMKVPAALEGAVLPNKMTITASKIRGAVSEGMLCAARELGLGEDNPGLFELPADAPLGHDIWDYLKLSDHILEIAVTPNRGDCLSMLGLAKEIAALTQSKLNLLDIPSVKSIISDQLSVVVHHPDVCPRYVGRIIRGVKADATTPIWLQERLRRSNVRCINPVVDVTNYVMLELGQPMHAFDLQKIAGNIQVRMARANEQLELLNAQTVQLQKDTLVIADEEKPLALAGIMGGLFSGVTLLTKDILLEGAFFNSKYIARTGRQYNLNSESSYRFERGIDPTLQIQAMERATQLLLEIVGGQAGPIIEVVHANHLPTPLTISLREARVEKILGFKIANNDIEIMLKQLGFTCESSADGWKVTVPPRRSDITLEADLIEEVIRVYGYDRVPLHHSRATLQISSRSENKLKQLLCDLGYHEAVTYSFIDKKLQSLFDPNQLPKELVNPITAEMSVMRTNLWPGLVSALLYNQNRQEPRVRLFEVGLRFIVKDNQLLQQKVVSGLVSGTAFPEQWAVSSRPLDFFDVKGDLQHIFKLTFLEKEFTFKPGTHPTLHPGQSADIYRGNQYVGVMGALHPSVMQALDISNVFVFELLIDQLDAVCIPRYKEISKFPEIRRDIAILIDQTIPSELIRDTISEVAGELLKDVNVFDVYQGKGIVSTHKSIALALTLQHSSRTLVDQEVADLLDRVVGVLKQRFAAELRG